MTRSSALRRTGVAVAALALTLALVPLSHAAMTPGDVAISGYYCNGASSAFSFVTLAPMLQGETVYFTDKGWSDANLVFYTGSESVFKFTATSNIPAGRLFLSKISAEGGAWANLTPTVNFTLQSTGDQVYAYQALDASPTSPTQHLFVLDATSTFESNLSSPGGGTGAKPAQLTAGYSALTMPNPGSGKGIHVTPSLLAAGQNSKNQWLTTFANIPANWTSWTGALPTESIVVRGGLTAPSAPVHAMWIRGSSDTVDVVLVNEWGQALPYSSSAADDAVVVNGGSGTAAANGQATMALRVDTASVGDKAGLVTINDLYTDVDQFAITGTVVEPSNIVFASNQQKSLDVALQVHLNEGGGVTTLLLHDLVENLDTGNGFTASADADDATIDSGAGKFSNVVAEVLALNGGERGSYTLALDTTEAGTFFTTITLGFSDDDAAIGGSALASDVLTLNLSVTVESMPEPGSMAALLSLAPAAAIGRRRTLVG